MSIDVEVWLINEDHSWYYCGQYRSGVCCVTSSTNLAPPGPLRCLATPHVNLSSQGKGQWKFNCELSKFAALSTTAVTTRMTLIDSSPASERAQSKAAKIDICPWRWIRDEVPDDDCDEAWWWWGARRLQDSPDAVAWDDWWWWVWWVYYIIYYIYIAIYI